MVRFPLLIIFSEEKRKDVENGKLSLFYADRLLFRQRVRSGSIRRQWRSSAKRQWLSQGKPPPRETAHSRISPTHWTAFGIAWILFDEIEENPSVETVERAAKLAIAEGVEFFIGIGGGSPMDSSKAIATMAAHPEQGTDALWNAENKALPVVAVPTTAGTGSEVTQYAIVTLHAKKNKIEHCRAYLCHSGISRPEIYGYPACKNHK